MAASVCKHAHVCMCAHAYYIGGSGGMPPPRKMLNLDPLRLLLMQSGTKLPKIILMIHTYVQ